MLPWVGGQPAAALTTLELGAGDLISLPHTGQGARSYLAIAGGIESERFMDSASTDVRGLSDAARGRRRHRDGDGGRLRAPHERQGRLAGRRRRVRILPGPQASTRALERLDGAELRTAAGDRTGVRLEGARSRAANP